MLNISSDEEGDNSEHEIRGLCHLRYVRTNKAVNSFVASRRELCKNTLGASVCVPKRVVKRLLINLR